MIDDLLSWRPALAAPQSLPPIHSPKEILQNPLPESPRVDDESLESYAESCEDEYYAALDNQDDEPSPEDLEFLREWSEDEETFGNYIQPPSYEEPVVREIDFESPLISGEAEQLLLGCYLNNPELLNRHTFSQVHSLFYYPRHRTIHDAITETEPLSLENLSRHLASRSQLERTGGIEYLSILQRSAQDHHSPQEADAYLITLEALADIRNLFPSS